MKNYKKKFLIVLSVSIAAVLACFLFCLLPASAALRSALMQAQSYKNKVNKAGRDSGIIEQLKNELEKSEEDLKLLNGRIAGENEVVDLVIILESLADKLQIDQEISIVRQQENSDGTPLKISLSGSYEGIIKYIKGVENSKYIISIDSCDLSKKENGIKANLILRIPIYEE